MADSKPSAKGVFDVARIRQLVELMKEHELQEIDLRESDQRIRLARAGAGMQPTYSVVAPPVAVSGFAAGSTAPGTVPPAAGGGAADGPNIKTINSPMVGTFYSKANPNSPPFVKVGDSVNPETVVCIIEAMKVFNEISAEMKGKIVAVLVDSETPVVFGRPLFKVDTSA
jgi:acetyl-CoA carboxylase biotin carboxyl carrier protein